MMDQMRMPRPQRRTRVPPVPPPHRTPFEYPEYPADLVDEAAVGDDTLQTLNFDDEDEQPHKKKNKQQQQQQKKKQSAGSAKKENKKPQPVKKENGAKSAGDKRKRQ